MAGWAIGVEIKDTRIDGEGLARLLEVLRRDFPELEAECALWSGVLVVHGRVASATPGEALESALATISSAFDKAGVDVEQASEITSVTIRRVSGADAARGDSLSGALLRLVPSRQRR